MAWSSMIFLLPCRNAYSCRNILVAAVCTFMLSETFRRPLPQTLVEAAVQMSDRTLMDDNNKVENNNNEVENKVE